MIEHGKENSLKFNEYGRIEGLFLHSGYYAVGCQVNPFATAYLALQ